jgi:hypothetical protein
MLKTNINSLMRKNNMVPCFLVSAWLSSSLQKDVDSKDWKIEVNLKY